MAQRRGHSVAIEAIGDRDGKLPALLRTQLPAIEHGRRLSHEAARALAVDQDQRRVVHPEQAEVDLADLGPGVAHEARDRHMLKAVRHAADADVKRLTRAVKVLGEHVVVALIEPGRARHAEV